MGSHRNDILLVEQIDRLTCLSNSDWMTLKSVSQVCRIQSLYKNNESA
jgi:DNA invertase Pin-like site-specific DNA recombinase